jgi:hypothetical protein
VDKESIIIGLISGIIGGGIAEILVNKFLYPKYLNYLKKREVRKKKETEKKD